MSLTPIKSLSRIPPASSKRIAIRVTAQAEQALRKFHPWLFNTSITNQSKEGKPGDLAVIFDNARRFLAIGLYDPTSPIRVRVLAHRVPVPINRDFFVDQIGAAANIREALHENTTGYRLVHGGNDKLPGLVVDRYADTLVIKLYTPAWFPHLKDIITGLEAISKWERIILRLSRSLHRFPELLYQLRDGEVLSGSSITGPVLFQENGFWFEADPVKGHKTGFYLDQRDNRARVGNLAKGKSVLNVFAYNGGFSVYAACGGARQVTSLDISKSALEAAKRNFTYNKENTLLKLCNHETVIGDAFNVLANIKTRQHYDMVIIDPPSFAKDRSQVQKAISAYKQLTRLGLNLLRSEGILVQASCSSRVAANDFFAAIHKSAREMGRGLKEIERTNHPIDHPIGFTEGAYLKCLFASAQ